MYDYKGLDHTAPADNTPISQLAAFIRESKRAFTGQLLANQTFEPGVEFGDAVYFDGGTSTWRPSIAHETKTLLVDGFALPHLNAVSVSAILHGPWVFEPGIYLYLSATNAGKLTSEETSYMVGRSLGAGMIVFAAGAALAKMEADKAAGWGARAEAAAITAEAAADRGQLQLAEIRSIADDAVADVNTSRELAMAELRDLAQVTSTTLIALYDETEATVRALVAEFTTQVTTTGEMYKELIESTATFARDSLNNTVTAAVNNLESQSVVFQARLKATGDAQSTRVQSLGTQVSGALVELGATQKEEVSVLGDTYVTEMRALRIASEAAAQEAKDAADRAVAVAGVDIATPERAGLVKGGVPGTNVDLATDGTLSVEFDRLVSRPEISVVGTAAIGYKYKITMSAVPLVPDRTIATFVLAIADGADIEVAALENAAEYDWTASGANNSVARIKIQAFDNLGYRSDVNYAYVTIKKVTVAKPMITSPSHNELDVPLFPALQATAFAITGMPGTAEYTHAQISTDPTFAEGTIVFDTTAVHAYTTAVFVESQLDDGVKYYVRMRHSASFYGFSEWAETVAFTTVVISIEKPRIMSPANGANSIGLTMSCAFTPIATHGINDTGLYTQMQFASDAGFANIYYDSGETSPYALTLAPSQLMPNAQYWVRMRHSGSIIGWSEWSDTISFATVVASMVKPSVLSPSEGEIQIGLTPTVTFTGPASSGISDTFKFSQLQLSITDDFAEILYDTGTISPTTAAVIPSDKLAYNGTYYARVRHEGTILAWSAWSAVRMFKTIVAKVSKPIVSSPTEQQVDVSRTPVILLSAFANVGPLDSPEQTQIQISRLIDFSAIVVDTGVSEYLTSFVVPEESRLIQLTRYYVRARHKGARFGWSGWSDTRTFTTLNQYISVPLIIAPANNAVDQPINEMKIKASAPATLNETVTKWEVQVSKSATFADVVWQTGQVALPANNEATIDLTLGLTTSFYIRARYFGEFYGWTAWSDLTTFKTLSAGVTAPTIQAPANNATGVALKPSVTLTPFANVGPVDTPIQTEIQISASPDFLSNIASYNGAFITTWACPVQLALITSYYIRARHRGNLWGWSPWAGTVKITTFNATVSVPVITSPTEGQLFQPLMPTIVLAASDPVNQTVDSMAVQVSTLEDFSVIAWQSGEIGDGTTVKVTTQLGLDTLHYVRARRKGSLSGVTAWSSPVAFRTLDAAVDAPVILTPTAGETGVLLTPTITLSAFSNVGPTDTPSGTSIRIYSDAALTVLEQFYDGTYLTSWKVPAALSLETPHWVVAQHEGNLWGKSANSVAVGFVTTNAYIEAPVITGVEDGAAGVLINASLTIAPAVLVAVPVADVKLKLEIIDNTAGQVIFRSEGVIAADTGGVLPLTNVVGSNTTYTVTAVWEALSVASSITSISFTTVTKLRFAAVGFNGGQAQWSASDGERTVVFTVLGAYPAVLGCACYSKNFGLLWSRIIKLNHPLNYGSTEHTYSGAKKVIIGDDRIFLIYYFHALNGSGAPNPEFPKLQLTTAILCLDFFGNICWNKMTAKSSIPSATTTYNVDCYVVRKVAEGLRLLVHPAGYGGSHVYYGLAAIDINNQGVITRQTPMVSGNSTPSGESTVIDYGRERLYTLYMQHTSNAYLNEYDLDGVPKAYFEGFTTAFPPGDSFTGNRVFQTRDYLVIPTHGPNAYSSVKVIYIHKDTKEVRGHAISVPGGNNYLSMFSMGDRIFGMYSTGTATSTVFEVFGPDRLPVSLDVQMGGTFGVSVGSSQSFADMRSALTMQSFAATSAWYQQMAYFSVEVLDWFKELSSYKYLSINIENKYVNLEKRANAKLSIAVFPTANRSLKPGTLQNIPRGELGGFLYDFPAAIVTDSVYQVRPTATYREG